MRKARSRTNRQGVALKKHSRVRPWSPSIRGVGLATTAIHRRPPSRFRVGLAFGFALAALGCAVTVAISRYHTWLYDWVNGSTWFLPATLAFMLLSLAGSIWTWRESRWARAAPLILVLSYGIIWTFSVGTW